MKKHLPLLNLLALSLSLVIHLLTYTNFLPFSLQEVRESRALLFLPDNIAIATWLVIYLGLLAYSIYQSRPSNRELVERASWYFIFTSIGKITWTILYIYGSVWMSTLAMIMTLAALIMLYERLNLRSFYRQGIEFWLVKLPFSLFLGWVSVLSVVNIATSLHDLGFQTLFLGISAEIWTVGLIIFLTALALFFLFMLGDTVFPLTIAWGALTIFARPFNSELFAQLQNLNLALVDVVAFLAFALLLLVVASRAVLSREKLKAESAA